MHHKFNINDTSLALFEVKFVYLFRLFRRTHFFAHLNYVLFQLLVIPLLAVIMFGMGMTLTFDDFRRVLRMPVIILIGLQIAFNFRALGFLERMGGAAWSRISPFAGRLLPVNSLPRALGLGLLWGLIPCGLVYSVLLVAATSGSAVDGAFVMLAFGTGTTPAMLLTGLGAARLAQLMQDRRTRLGAGLLIVLLGILTLFMPITALMSPGPHSHH